MREKPIAKLVKAVAGSRKLHLKDLKKRSKPVNVVKVGDMTIRTKARSAIDGSDKYNNDPTRPSVSVPVGRYGKELGTTMEYKRKNSWSKNPPKPSMRGDIPASKKSQMGFGDDVSRSRDPILQRHVKTAAKIAIGGAGFAAGSAWSEHKRKQRGY